MGTISNYCDHAQHHNSHFPHVSNEQKHGTSHHDGEQIHGNSAGRTPRDEDGQHYSGSYYNPGQETGQKTSIRESARVGMQNGPKMTIHVPKPSRDADIKTTSHSAGPRVLGEITSGDDQK